MVTGDVYYVKPAQSVGDAHVGVVKLTTYRVVEVGSKRGGVTEREGVDFGVQSCLGI